MRQIVSSIMLACYIAMCLENESFVLNQRMTSDTAPAAVCAPTTPITGDIKACQKKMGNINQESLLHFSLPKALLLQSHIGWKTVFLCKEGFAEGFHEKASMKTTEIAVFRMQFARTFCKLPNRITTKSSYEI